MAKRKGTKRKGVKSWVRSAYAHLAARDRLIKSKDSSFDSYRKALYHDACVRGTLSVERPLSEFDKSSNFYNAGINARACISHGHKISDKGNFWQPYRDEIKRKSRK
ncbi:MAG: hypothetical protein J6Z04_06690 [Clostridia bacterium]|nr:hypothetical protein [Clostridia bacterium]